MGLPAYLLEQPKTNPIDVVSRQIRNLGFDVDLSRAGNTLTIRNFDSQDHEQALVVRAMRLITNFADANNLSLDAIVYPIEGNIICHYERAGFLIHVDHGDDGDDNTYTLLHRAVRN